MAVKTTNYGTFVTHEGTLAEVSAAMRGDPSSSIISVIGNTDLTSFVAVQEYMP